jgi:hypothetical protein
MVAPQQVALHQAQITLEAEASFEGFLILASYFRHQKKFY